MHYVNLYDRTCGRWILGIVSPLTIYGLYLLCHGDVGKYVPRFMQQYVLIENETRVDDSVKISLSKSLEEYLRKLARKNLVTLVEDAYEGEIILGTNFHGIRMVEIKFKNMTLFKKEMKKFYESEKKNIFESQNTIFPRCINSDMKNIFERSDSFFPKIMQFFGFLKRKRVKRFVVGSDQEFNSTATEYIKV
jgi:hypothetical protein